MPHQENVGALDWVDQCITVGTSFANVYHFKKKSKK